MKWALACLVGFVTVSLAGCYNKPKAKTDAETAAPVALTPQEKLTQQAIDLFNQATETMTSIKDRAGATAVSPKLKNIAIQLQDLNRRGVPMGSQVRENPQGAGRLKDDLERAIQRYAEVAVRRLAQENVLGSEFQNALREFGKLPN